MAERCFVGFDTSNYTTSAAVVTEAGEVIANIKAPLPVKAGECGLRQSDALFAHVKNLPDVTGRLRAAVGAMAVAGVGVSARPRDIEGSYMPCFLAGVAAAEAFAAGANAPVRTFSHQSGHLAAALYGADAWEKLRGKPFGAFHVSGGTTDMLYVTPRENGFAAETVGGTADLNAGQAVDRVGVAMGLNFPCGPALEELAARNTKKVPRPRVCVRAGECHLSGLENLAVKLYRETNDAPLTAAFTLRFIADTLFEMATFLRETKGSMPILFAGGVMSNRLIAADLTKRLDDVYFSTPAFSADNAAGAALLCRAAMI